MNDGIVVTALDMRERISANFFAGWRMRVAPLSLRSEAAREPSCSAFGITCVWRYPSRRFFGSLEWNRKARERID